MDRETKLCPGLGCGRNAILTRTGVVLESFPEIYCLQWWCACGYREEATPVPAVTRDELNLQAWREVNGQ